MNLLYTCYCSISTSKSAITFTGVAEVGEINREERFLPIEDAPTLYVENLQCVNRMTKEKEPRTAAVTAKNPLLPLVMTAGFPSTEVPHQDKAEFRTDSGTQKPC